MGTRVHVQRSIVQGTDQQFTVRLRTRVTKGPGSGAAGLAMAFKLIESAQQRWCSANAPRLVALVRAGAVFEKGVMIERPTEQDQEGAASSCGNPIHRS
jgi:hypothetical protein